MGDPGTDTLRKLAPCWSLAGDDQLLSILENTHKRLISRCEEANCQLEQMTIALNDSNISLQNVNNQFMALSSSQFIESRVYDDDDTVEEPAVKELPKAEVPDELSSLKRSVFVLEDAHEVITILHDSETESDTDDESPDRVVLKPKDVYADRPLPYIIGSQPWKNKWHAGLVAEDSDSESSTSKVDRDSDQYSQSEPEDIHTDKLPVSDLHDTTISETSSELPSEQGSVPKPTPSDVASEIARRLGSGQPPKMVEREPEYEEPAKPTVRKVYRPQEPVTSTIFPDEPPPLSDHSDAESDIFAELHRSQPYSRTQATDDLFSFNDERYDDDGGDIFSDLANKPVTDPSVKPTSLFDAGPKPHMFEHGKLNHVPSGHVEHTYETPETGEKTVDEREKGVKKPIGGISLFGNKGTESIGAAILKRNQRKSSTSGEDSGSDVQTEPSHTNPQIRKEKDIFDDLFARSEGKKVTKDNKDVVKGITAEIKKQNDKKVNVEKIKEKPAEKAKVDLFSDNLFDDIDDIFTTNVVKMPSKDNVKPKSIFDDDDDLFSEITAPKTKKIEATSSNNKGLFDSDDELFSDNITTPKNQEKSAVTEKSKILENTTKISESPVISNVTTKSIFDDDEDDIFSDVKFTNKLNNTSNLPTTSLDIQKDNKQDKAVNNLNTPKSSVFKSPSLFDDEDDESDLFAEPIKSTATSDHKELTSKTEDITSIEKLKENIDVTTNSAKNVVIDQIVVKNNNSVIDSNNKFINSIPERNKSLEDSFESNLSENDKSLEKSKIEIDTNAAKIFDQIDKHIKNIDPSSSDTNDDFSEQDFDDLPPKEKTKPSVNSTPNLVPESKNTEVTTDSTNIFDNNSLKDDIFDKKENTDAIFKDNETETISNEFNKTEYDNTNKATSPNTIEDDIFSDILTEPPVFEKPKEPKKSKNVNALFDDDSDDESLFFKKNDVISDEKPEDFIPTQDRIFGIFTDEPPDDGFSKISDDFDDDLFSTMPKPKKPSNEVSPPLPDTVEFDDTVPNNEFKSLDSKVNTENNFINRSVSNKKPNTAATDTLNNSNEDKSKTEKVKDAVLSIDKKESSSTLSDEELFKSPKTEPIKEVKPKQLDILSDDEELFASVPKIDKPNRPSENKKQESMNITSDDELFKQETRTDTTIQEIDKRESDSKSDEDIFKKPISKLDLPTQKGTENESKAEKSEPRKVGKLKVGLNINVNALLPGASPKKVAPPKLNDQTDGQTQSVAENTKTDTKIIESQNPDSKLLKSVSFDGEPDSEVLDNKLSKERAKIQVKRRPSTRKARREAVRKSAIDFGDDSTDNSSSIDGPPRIQPEKPDKNKNVNAEEGKSKDLDHDTVKPRIHTENLDQNTVKPITKAESIDQSDEKVISESQIPPRTVETETKIQPELKSQKEIETPSIPKDVKSKVVYILNDEDIFNTTPVNKTEGTNKDLTDASQKSKNIVQNLDTNAGISTLGKVYDASTAKSDVNTKKDTKSSLFGDEDDDEIFKAKPVIQKSSLFDSDSDEELFGTSKRKVETKEVKKETNEIKKEMNEIKKEVVKGSLFGDEDDDDDLFGVKTKKSVDSHPQPPKPTAKETPKSVKPVFEDPLSMFGDDD